MKIKTDLLKTIINDRKEGLSVLIGEQQAPRHSDWGVSTPLANQNMIMQAQIEIYDEILQLIDDLNRE